MLQSEQIPLEEWFSLAKSLFSDEILSRKKLTTFST